MAATMVGRRDGDGHTDRATNPRSRVGGAAEPDVLHASEDSTIARGIHRGAWRRPPENRTRAEVIGFVLWWLVMGALAAASVIFIIKQS